MDLLLIIVFVVVGIVALLLMSGATSRSQGDAIDGELKADPDRQFRRPPNEGDLL